MGLRQRLSSALKSLKSKRRSGEGPIRRTMGMNNTPMTSAGNTEICSTVRQSNHTSRNPTARGATASAPMVPPMAWMPSARALRSGIFWVSTPVATGCQAASP